MTHLDDYFENFTNTWLAMDDPNDVVKFMATMPDELDDAYDEWTDRRQMAKVAVADLMARVMDSEEA